MSTFKNKNSLRTIEAQIVQKLKNNEARQNLLVLQKKKAGTVVCRCDHVFFLMWQKRGNQWNMQILPESVW